MTAILRVARADLRERSRTFALLVVIAATLQAGFLFVPDASATYSTVDLGGWRGVYNSGWMGVATALLTLSYLPIFGFFLIRPALSRDAQLGTYDLVAAAPLSRRAVVFGKWLSNVTVLSALAVLLVTAAVVMQIVRGEDRTIVPSAYALPLVLFALPACAITAACAVAIDCFKFLRGIGGSIAWLCAIMALLSIPLLMTGGRHAAPLDPFGYTTLTASLLGGLHGAVAAANAHGDLSIGVSARSTHTFRFNGLAFAWNTVAERAAWCAFAALAVVAVGPFALSPAQTPAKRRRFAAFPARLAARLPGSRTVRAELSAALGTAGVWWLCGSALLAVAALLVPMDFLMRIVAPLAWIWPIGPIAGASVLDERANVGGVLLATPTPAWRRIVARWTACTMLAVVPVIALALRDGWPGIALLAIACALVATAIALGTVFRMPVAFEALSLIAWYLGPVNRLGAFDPAAGVAHPFVTSACAVALTVLSLALASIRVARRS